MVTIIQARTPDEVRSRVFAAEDGASHAAFSVSAFTGGLLVQLGSARGAFATAAALGIGAAVLTSRARHDTATRGPSPDEPPPVDESVTS